MDLGQDSSKCVELNITIKGGYRLPDAEEKLPGSFSFSAQNEVEQDNAKYKIEIGLDKILERPIASIDPYRLSNDDHLRIAKYVNDHIRSIEIPDLQIRVNYQIAFRFCMIWFEGKGVKELTMARIMEAIS